MVFSKEQVQAFIFVFVYGLSFYAFQVLLHQRDMAAMLPGNDNLVGLDAGWYKFIVDKGYIYKGGWGNAGFYPLFPMVWKLSHLGPLGISFLNIVFLACGFALLANKYQLSAADRLIWMSTPSLYYVFVPYSEALSFLLGSLLLYGIWQNNKRHIWISLLLLGLVRPVAIVLLPALVIMEVMANNRQDIVKSLKVSAMRYALPLAVATAIFVLYQYQCTGVWFAYFQHQAGNWGRRFSIPKLPFNSALGPKFLWLNATALFVGFVSLLLLLKKVIAWWRARPVDKVLLLSLLFLFGTALVNILTNTAYDAGYTNVFSSQRYILATPFFLVFLYHFTRQNTYKPLQFLWLFLLSNIFWLLFASYLHIMYLVYFNFVTAIIVLYMLYANNRNGWPALAIMAINIFVQVQAFQMFIGGIYTD